MIALVLGSLLAGTIVLRAESGVAGPTVEMAEIAEIRGFDADTTRRLGALQLGPTPAPGNARGVRREDVALALRNAGLEAAISGAAVCRATPRTEVVSPAELEEAARRSLGTLFAGRDVEITLVRPAAELRVVAAESRRDLVADLARREPQPGSWSVPVDVLVDGTRAAGAWIALDVAAFELQPVATRPLRRGETVDAASWTLVRGRVEPGAARSATSEQLAGASATRDLVVGTRIGELDVRRDPIVRVGDMVELEVVRGQLRARTRAVARGQGAIGDRVEVQTGEGQRRLVGTVVERGLVRLELAAAPRSAR